MFINQLTVRKEWILRNLNFYTTPFRERETFFKIFFLERETYQRGRGLAREGKLPEKETDQRGGSSAREFIREGSLIERGCIREGARGLLRKGKLSERDKDQIGGLVIERGLLERGTY